MNTVSDEAKTAATLYVDPLWTMGTGRAFARLMLVSVGAFVGLLKYGGVREYTAAHGPAALVWVWSWTPSYLTALALPFMWPAIGQYVRKNQARVTFIPEALTSGFIVFVLETLDALDDGNTFSWTDLIAVVVGAATAYILYRVVVRQRS